MAISQSVSQSVSQLLGEKQITGSARKTPIPDRCFWNLGEQTTIPDVFFLEKKLSQRDPN